MNIEEVREYCMSLPMVTEDSPFGDDVLTFRLFEKIFACLSLDGSNILDLKCAPEYAIELRERYSEIEPAWHWNKKYWNQMNVEIVNKEFLTSLIRHSYAEVVKKLTKKLKAEYPEITLIQ